MHVTKIKQLIEDSSRNTESFIKLLTRNIQSLIIGQLNFLIIYAVSIGFSISVFSSNTIICFWRSIIILIRARLASCDYFSAANLKEFVHSKISPAQALAFQIYHLIYT